MALVAGLIGPVAILLQGQVWRWVWVTGLISVLMLMPTVVDMWRAELAGSLCVMLLLTGWLVSGIHGVYFAAAALCLWYGRERIPRAAAPYLRLAAALIGLLVLARIGVTGWIAVSSAMAATRATGGVLLIVRTILGLECLPLVLAFLVINWVRSTRSLAIRGTIAFALGAATAIAVPGALEDPRAEGTAAQIAEFADWRDAIPPGDNVLVVPRYYSAGFAWLTLQRPSYLTVDQSSGVIFSRATAVEVRRRSEVLLPIEDPDWRLLTRRLTHGAKFDAAALPLTRDRLARICADPELNFVVAKEDVGFEAIGHHHPGVWNGWNLYDCKKVTSFGHPQ
jgi:hypothetical protein